jgi:hypothetical protein
MDGIDKMDKEPLIPKHGGYRKLKRFRMAVLVYDVTVRSCDRYIDKEVRIPGNLCKCRHNAYYCDMQPFGPPDSIPGGIF